jgi:hypothetical protein
MCGAPTEARRLVAAHQNQQPSRSDPHEFDRHFSHLCVCVCVCVCVCFITAGPITKLCAWGEEESGGHVL